jgi:hypothetical protein
MHKEKGMGRTRLTRFAAITVPAGVATVGLGIAVVQGMVGATLSSAHGFNLESPSLAADSLAVTGGAATPAGANTPVVFARVDTAKLNTMCIGAYQAVPSVISNWTGIDKVGVDLKSSALVSLPSVDLNAADIEANSAVDTGVDIPAGDVTGGVVKIASTDADYATLGQYNGSKIVNGHPAVNTALGTAVVGVAQSDTHTNGDASAPALSAADDPNYSADDFALAGTDADLYNVSATSYAITLHGLSLGNLSIKPKAYGSGDETAGVPNTCSGFVDDTFDSSAN